MRFQIRGCMAFGVCCPLRAADGYQWRRAPAIMAAGCARARHRRKHHSGCVDRRLVPFGGGLPPGRTCTLPLAQSHLHSPTSTFPLAQSYLHSPTCTVPLLSPPGALLLAYSPLHIRTGAVPRADTSHQLVCAERHALSGRWRRICVVGCTDHVAQHACAITHVALACCLLSVHVACCILSVASCMLRVASCILHLASCTLHLSCCRLPAASCMLSVVCCSQCGRRRPFSAR